MMYYLTGIDVAKGTIDDDISKERPYYELGWEITTTHFDAKHLLHTGQIDPQRDTIVTCSGREFLYTGVFDHVLDYHEFLTRQHKRDRVISLMDRYAAGIVPADYFDRPHGPTAKFRQHRASRDLLLNLDIRASALAPPNRPYCCFVIRRRSHGAYRNVPDSAVRMILAKLSKRYDHVFIVGRDIEHFAGQKVRLVDLVTFTRLIQHPRCRLIVGSLTGPMHLAALVSSAKVCVVINHDDYDVHGLNHPVLMGHCITFSKSHFLFVSPEAVEYLLETYDV